MKEKKSVEKAWASPKTLKLMALLAGALILGVTGVLWFGGKEPQRADRPDREYILAQEEGVPQNLHELLHSDRPQVESLLIRPQIAQEILEADSLQSIVDSRWALNNFKEIDRELDALCETYRKELQDSGIPEEALGGDEEEKLNILSLPASPEDDEGAWLTIAAQYGGGPGGVQRASLNEQLQDYRELIRLKEATEKLLTPDSAQISTLTPEILLKAVWEPGAQVLLHIFPSGDWLPEEGYRLYRQVGDKKELLRSDIASPKNFLSGKVALENADLIEGLYAQADLSPSKLSQLGMDRESFRKNLYVGDLQAQKQPLSGAADFLHMKKAEITLADQPRDKIPSGDILASQSLFVQGKEEDEGIRSRLLTKLSVTEVSPELNPLWHQLGSSTKMDLAMEILAAREQLATLSFVDEAFAETAGFLIRDDLSALNLKEGEKIEYVVEDASGLKSSRILITGQATPLSPPRDVLGFGIDSRVLLRWGETENPLEREIISGYHIERKRKGEGEYVRITPEPVVSAYTQDETLLYLETPVNFEDFLDNGEEAQYRIYAVDIFGRTGPPSEPLSLRVEKITPPSMPTLFSALMSGPEEKRENLSKAVLEALEANKNQKGILLPLAVGSEDTVRLSVYRAEALGARAFGEPQRIADLDYTPKADLTSSTGPKLKPVKDKNGRHLFLEGASPEEPDLLFFDSRVEEGTTYKYWISAWDSWNNESAWSPSVTLGLPSDVLPQNAQELTAAMLSRELPDYSLLPPGVYRKDLITRRVLQGLDEEKPTSVRSYTTDTTLIRNADSLGIKPGASLSAEQIPTLLSSALDSLPDEKLIHLFTALQGERVSAAGTAHVKWPAYSGEGFGGYVVYKPLFTPPSLEELQGLTRAELLQLGAWQRLTPSPLKENRLALSGLSQDPQALHLFLIALKPEESDATLQFREKLMAAHDLSDYYEDVLEGGFVKLEWKAPEDAQVKFYRVYRSEVENFEGTIDEDHLSWTLVGDNIRDTTYTERVEQTHAHYYYYKVTSVTPWSVESKEPILTRLRVPSTKPPEAPALLLPLSRKDGVQINFSSVKYCERYEIHRAEIPRIRELDLEAFKKTHGELARMFFSTPSEEDTYFSTLLAGDLQKTMGIFSRESRLSSLNRFKTQSLRSTPGLAQQLEALPEEEGLRAYEDILERFGPLALMDYRDLSLQMAEKVTWTKIGEIPAAEQKSVAIEGGSFLKPLSFIDTTAEFGKTYLYTVQAWNDDDLGSLRPEPLEATPRRKGPFDPLSGLSATIAEEGIALSWNAPTMKNLSWEQCLEDTVGYIVYRSDSREGSYDQVSPLVFEPHWTDPWADSHAYNWYRVKVLDRGGYLSEFSEPLLVHRPYLPLFKPRIPPLAENLEAPSVAFSKRSFTLSEGAAFRTAYQLSGTPPITLELQVLRNEEPFEGFYLDEENKEVYSTEELRAGNYLISLRAINALGEDRDRFILDVSEAGVVVAPKLEDREDNYRFTQLSPMAFSVQLSAQGTEPLTWSLEPFSERMTLPKEVSIAQGLLKVEGKIALGHYSFFVKVANEAGEDRREVALSVVKMPIFTPIKPTLGLAPDGVSEGALEKLAFDFSSTPRPLLSEELGTKLQGKRVKCADFWLTDIELNPDPALFGYSGKAMLDIGATQSIPVSFQNAFFSDTLETMQAGSVFLERVVELPETGITLASLLVEPGSENPARVSGFVQSLKKESNLFGSQGILEFEEERLSYGWVTIHKALADFRYQQFTLQNRDGAILSLNPKVHGFLLQMGERTQVSMAFHLETLHNEGLRFLKTDHLFFDEEGRINGWIMTDEVQSLQLLVPGGSALRVEDAYIHFQKGEVSELSGLLGRLILPFEQDKITGVGAPAQYATGHTKTNVMDALLVKHEEGLSPTEKMALKAALAKFAETVQQNGLLIVPEDAELQESCSYISVEIHGWNARGFTLKEAPITPTRVTNRNLDMELQRTQAIVVEGTTVGVDLSREHYLPEAVQSGEIETPKETQEPFWVGVIYRGGKLSLPPAFITTRSGNSIDFTLAEGEMIYDLNGYNYQNYLYNPKGVPASFGESLNNFENVWVFDCLLDLYANQVNLEINAEVAVEVLLNQRMKVKLYTNKEDNADGKAGEFLCSVAPTQLPEALAKGIALRVESGWIRSDGMHLSGDFALDTQEVKTEEPLAFSDMILPSRREAMVQEEELPKLYGHAALDKPVNLDFKNFTMEIRALDITNRSTEALGGNVNDFTLQGATELSDNIPLSTASVDKVMIECNQFLNTAKTPKLLYASSLSQLKASFDGCVDIEGVLVPKIASAEGLVEFDTQDLLLGFLSNLTPSGVKTGVRFGYDTLMSRCYFAVGLGYDGVPLSFGVGEVKDFTGLVLYNMVVQRDERQRFRLPAKPADVEGFIQGLEVHREAGSSFAGGLTGTLGVYGLCEVRHLYFGFERGPIVEAGGELFVPLNIGALIGGSDPYTALGEVSIGYHHPDRYFALNLSIKDRDLLVARVGGDLGFEYSPRIFGIYVGYPDPLRGRIGIFDVGVGLALKNDKDGGSMAAARLELSIDKDVSVSIVYVRGYVYVGAEGIYFFDEARLNLSAYLKGGMEGGIRALGKKFNIISFYLDARGELESSSPFSSWSLKAHCRVSYHLNLCLKTISGSVNANLSTKIGGGGAGPGTRYALGCPMGM